jgi:hypothetical protein
VKQEIQVFNFYLINCQRNWRLPPQLNNTRTELEQKALLLEHVAKLPRQDFEQFCRCLCLTNQKHIVEEHLQIPSASAAQDHCRGTCTSRYATGRIL